jgi:hypothetical protein
LEHNNQAPNDPDRNSLSNSITEVNEHPGPQTRRRIHRNTSVKGIVTYESTIETFSGTLEDTIAEQLAMDNEIAKLQPQYEEWVTPLPRDGS